MGVFPTSIPRKFLQAEEAVAGLLGGRSSCFLINALYGTEIRLSVNCLLPRCLGPCPGFPLMLHAARILCLVPPVPTTLQQSFHLAQGLDAALHVMPHPLPNRDAVDWDDARSTIDRLGSDASRRISVQIVEKVPKSMSAVLQYVSDSDIDLVVTDTPSDQGPVPVLATDTSKVLVEQLDCPVFIAEHATDPASIHDILVPTDLSSHSFSAFKHAVALARLYEATVHVLHVVESIPYVALTPTDRLSLGSMPLSEHRGRSRLRAFLREGTAAEVPIQSHVGYGDPVDRIVRFAAPSEIDLMVLSSHGSGGQSHLPLGQVAKRVLGRVTCPLFLCRAFGVSLLSPPPHSEGTGASTA